MPRKNFILPVTELVNRLLPVSAQRQVVHREGWVTSYLRNKTKIEPLFHKKSTILKYNFGGGKTLSPTLTRTDYF